MKDRFRAELKLNSEVRRLLKRPEEIGDLLGRRLALIAGLTQGHFTDPRNTFRIAVIGDPNLGKTTYSYSVAKILEMYGTPSSYFDLDVYTESGRAISGEKGWQERRKRSLTQIKRREIKENIRKFGKIKPGIVIGDFPGMSSDKFQVERIHMANMALIFAGDYKHLDPWIKLCTRAHIYHRFLISRPKFSMEPPIYPQINRLYRKPISNLPLIASATSLLLESNEMTHGPKIEIGMHFNDAERTILEEIFDFYFSIQMTQ